MHLRGDAGEPTSPSQRDADPGLVGKKVVDGVALRGFAAYAPLQDEVHVTVG